MPLSRDVREKLNDILCRHDGSESFETLLRHCTEALGEDGFLGRELLESYHQTRLLEAAKAQEVWFGALAWWLAKVLMWSSLAAAVMGVVWFGPRAVDPLTSALIGAAGYYVCIQIFTPSRLKRERERLHGLLKRQRHASAESAVGETSPPKG